MGLDHEMVDESKKVKEYKIGEMVVMIDQGKQILVAYKQGITDLLPVYWLNNKPTKLFKRIGKLL